MHIWICIFCMNVHMYLCLVPAPRQRLASVLRLLLSDKSSHHFTDLNLWLVFVLASPVPPRFNVDCDLPLIWCGHFLDKSSHQPKHNCANIDFRGSGGQDENKFFIFTDERTWLATSLVWWCELLSDICLNEASC